MDARPRTGFLGWLQDHRAAIAVLGLVLVVQSFFVIATRDDPLFRAPDLDEMFYHVWARSLAEGQGDFQGPYFLGPLYPHALSWLYRLLGPDVHAARVAQTVLGFLCTVLVLALGSRLFGRRAGIAAAILFGFLGPLAFYQGLLLVEIVHLALVTGALAALVLPRRRLVLWSALAGALLGLAALGRATALFALPVALATIWQRDGRARSLAPAIACTAAALLLIAPVVVRNSRLGGGLSITTNGGVNLWAGNHPGATGRFHEPEGIRFFREPALPSANPAAPLPAGVARSLTVRAAAGTERAADSAHWRRLAFVWMGANPGAAIQLAVRKVGLVLHAKEEAHLESYEFHRARIGALRLLPIDFGWLWPLGFLGGWVVWRERRRQAWIPAGFLVAMLLPCILFFVTSRYRLAAAPMVAIFAGVGVASLLGWIRAREWRSGTIALAIVIVLGVLVHLGGAPPPSQRAWEHAQMASRWYALGKLDDAVREQERAAALAPALAEAQVDLARYWSERGQPGDLQRAEALLRETARRAPDRALVPFVLGTVLIRMGRSEEARAAWQQALAIDPGFEPARARLRQFSSQP